jgi:uncharacterized membrane protein YphA (DoxX/SURF4 family)
VDRRLEPPRIESLETLVVDTLTVTLPLVVAQAVAAVSLGLLAASGIAKLVDPAPTTGAMEAARLPASRSVSYALGLVELVAAVAALLIGGSVTAVAAGLYLAFALFTFSAVRKRIPIQSCGCFGRDDTPPNAIHVVYNTIASISLFALVALSYSPIDWSLPTTELALYLSFIVIGVSASYLVLTRLPQVLAMRSTA